VECLDTLQCSDPAKPACVGYACSPCGGDPAQCSPIFCDVPSGRCVACRDDNDCTGTGLPHCVNHQCVLCASDDQCRNANPSKPYCVQNTCVQCRTGADCTDPASPACKSGTCDKCTADPDCPASRVCKVSTGACVECTSDSQCGAFGYCDTGPGDCLCKTCDHAADCAAGRCEAVLGGNVCTQTCTRTITCPAGFGCTNQDGGYCRPANGISCKALSDLRRNATCSDDTQCGLYNPDGGPSDDHARNFVNCPADPNSVVCATNVSPKVCTYRCGSAQDCPAGFTCPDLSICFTIRWCVPN
jgi:hypothetical protein